MKWFTALIFGAILGGILPTVIDGQSGVWADSWAGWGTYRPNAGGFLFSVPLFLLSALAARMFFNWHSRG
jgi:hypothetical protein